MSTFEYQELHRYEGRRPGQSLSEEKRDYAALWRLYNRMGGYRVMTSLRLVLGSPWHSFATVMAWMNGWESIREFDGFSLESDDIGLPDYITEENIDECRQILEKYLLEFAGLVMFD